MITVRSLQCDNSPGSYTDVCVTRGTLSTQTLVKVRSLQCDNFPGSYTAVCVTRGTLFNIDASTSEDTITMQLLFTRDCYSTVSSTRSNQAEALVRVS